jgi:hypothetical protein
MEKVHNFNIVGSESDSEREKITNELNNRLNNSRSLIPEKELDRLKATEYPKGPLETAAISFANEYSNLLMRQAGVESHNIPTDNYYVLPKGEYSRITDSDDSSGFAFIPKKAILINALECNGKPLKMALVILHETLHCKSFLSMELKSDESDSEHKVHREGVAVKSSIKNDKEKGFKHEHFRGLHEAIIANLEKRALFEMSKLPELQDEIARLNTPEMIEKKKKISERRKISAEDLVWVSDVSEDNNFISYPRSRFVLDYICDEIQKQFYNQYKNPEEVFQEFSNAQFNGELLTIARLVGATFGEDSFRILGNMDTDANSAALCLETLKKLRLKNL